MPSVFHSAEWLKELEAKINTDERYARVAKNWEGDLFFFIEPDEYLNESLTVYLDLWHGTCRKAEYNPQPDSHPNPAFTLTATYGNITAILSGTINPITAMMTGKLKVKGSMSYMLRNIPAVLDFVRVAQEVTKEII